MSENTTMNQAAAAAEEAHAPMTMGLALADDATAVTMSDRFAGLDIGADLTTTRTGWCSLAPTSERDQTTLYNAVGSPEKLSSMINKQISVVHVYAEIIQCVDEETGEVANAPRVILIDDHGKGYQAVSVGIYNCVKRMLQIYGLPDTWSSPRIVEVQHVDLAGGRHTFNLKVIK